jgi:hypothetical protein
MLKRHVEQLSDILEGQSCDWSARTRPQDSDVDCFQYTGGEAVVPQVKPLFGELPIGYSCNQALTFSNPHGRSDSAPIPRFPDLSLLMHVIRAALATSAVAGVSFDSKKC